MNAVKLHRPARAPGYHSPAFQERHKKFLRSLAVSAGLTDQELALRCRAGQTDARGRRSELVRMGLVEDSKTVRGEKGRRKSTVWRVSRAGVTKVRQIGGVNHV